MPTPTGPTIATWVLAPKEARERPDGPFLTLEEALAIHAQQIRDYGGAPGIRDMGLLQSALAMPQQSFADAYIHGDVHEMAAAYLFHICKNHPFLDGNKRVALATALAFLGLNGVFIDGAYADDAAQLTEDVTRSKASKAAVAVWLAQHTAP